MVVDSLHLCSLMYIASLGYRWLKSDDICEEFLKTGEVVLLRVLFLASLRLYCHILTGDMRVSAGEIVMVMCESAMHHSASWTHFCSTRRQPQCKHVNCCACRVVCML